MGDATCKVGVCTRLWAVLVWSVQFYAQHWIRFFIRWVGAQEAGMPLSEGLSLHVRDLDFESQIITVRRAKGGKDRTVMLPRALAVGLRTQLKVAPERLPRAIKMATALALINKPVTDFPTMWPPTWSAMCASSLRSATSPCFSALRACVRRALANYSTRQHRAFTPG